MQIGTMFFGKVDSALGESIQTKYFVLGLPILPLTSYYALNDLGTGVSGFEIPMHGKSVMFGFLRVWAGIGAFIVALMAFIDKRGKLIAHPWIWFSVLVSRPASSDRDRQRGGMMI